MKFDKLDNEAIAQVLECLKQVGVVEFELKEFQCFLPNPTIRITKDFNWCIAEYNSDDLRVNTLFEINLYRKVSTLYSAMAFTPSLFELVRKIMTLNVELKENE